MNKSVGVSENKYHLRVTRLLVVARCGFESYTDFKIKNNMKQLITLIGIAAVLVSCAGSDGARYDMNSYTFKRKHNVHMSPPRTYSGPQSGRF